MFLLFNCLPPREAQNTGLAFLLLLLSHVRLFATPRTAARQASLSFTISQSLLKLMSIESVMPSNHLILAFLNSPFYEPGLSPQDHLSHCKAPADLCSWNLSLCRSRLQLTKLPAREQMDPWAECSPDLLVFSGLLKLCFLRWGLGPSLVHLS